MNTEHASGYEDAGPLVRPYALTGGRTRPIVPGLDMISTVVALQPPSDLRGLSPEQAAIVDVCHRAISVAEVSAHLDLPLSVVKVLVSDLVSSGAVVARDPVPMAELPETNLLQAVLDGIRRL